ncbi:type II secretion system F family protein [Prauserella oleivorans]
MVPPLAVADDAATRREEFRSAVIAYLDLVAQERMAGRAAAQALSEAADVFDGWAFTRIRGTLAHAQRAGHLPWEALTRLADRMSSPELADVADIASTAADGAAVHATLTAKATGLRRAALATEKAAANTRSQRLTLPVTLLLLGFLLLVLYPAVIRLFTT